MKRLLVASIGILIGSVIATAGPITYNVSRSVGTGSINGFIETDGTTGTYLTATNIVNWDLMITSGGNNLELTGPNSGSNSQVLIVGTDLTATSTQLLFNFSDSGSSYVLFQKPPIFDGQFYYCNQDGGPNPCLSGESITPTSYDNGAGPGFVNVPQPSNDVVGSVSSAVPEPQSYVLILSGLAFLVRKRGRTPEFPNSR